MNQAGRWRWAALRGNEKKPETDGTPPAPIKIDAGFELPVADHPWPDIYM